MNSVEVGINAFKMQDYTKAFESLKPFAEIGNSEAQCIIGNMYDLGFNIERNMPEAIQWYLRSAAQGYSVASNNLGTTFWAGY